jgi:hypothetical protein
MLFTLNYFKLNYSTNLRLYLRLFYFKLIYVISSYTLSYSRSFYFVDSHMVLRTFGRTFPNIHLPFGKLPHLMMMHYHQP